MQRSKGNKKNQGRDVSKNWDKMPIPSLRLMQKKNPDASILQRVTLSFAGFFEARMASLLTTSASTEFDKNADTDYIESYLAQLAANIQAYQKQLDSIERKIKDLKKNKKDIAQHLLTNRRGLRELIDHLQIDQVSGLAENIREHSARRIDLFFLLLIAVYKQNVIVNKSKTSKQHGKGDEKTLTAGCHSSLFPCLQFERIQKSIASSIINNLWAQFTYSTSVPPSPNGEQILEDTHFAEALNMTTQLPDCVNKFDCHMEKQGIESSSLVQIAHSILNKTSRGEINPIQGLNEFCDSLYAFFSSLQLKYIKPDINYNANGTRGKTPKSFALIWEYEREGALRNMQLYSAGTEMHAAASSSYIYAMLGMNNLPFLKRAIGYVYSGYTEQRILEIQHEIFKWKFDPTNEEYKKTEEYKQTLVK